MSDKLGSAGGTLARVVSVSCLVCVGVLTFLFYLATTGQHSFFLDSTEFVTVAAEGGVAHPPGTPLYVILSCLFTLLPVGAAAFRLHLLGALLGATAAAMVYLLALAVMGNREERPWFSPLVACAVALATAVSPAIWFQSVRAEVYALNAVISLAIVLATLAWAQHPKVTRWPLTIALGIGLGGANHHYLALLVALPCVIWLLALRATRREILSKRFPLYLSFALAGLAAYAWLLLRAGHGWRMWGDPGTLSGLWSMISAAAFHVSVTELPHAPIPEAMITIFAKWVDLLGLALFVTGWLGLGVLLALRRREGWLLLLLVLAGALSKAVMYLDVENPDDHGYFLIGIHALAVAAAAIPSVVGIRARMAAVAAGCVVLSAVSSGWAVYSSNLEKYDMSAFQGPDQLNRHFLERVPPDALFMPSYYASFFNHLYFTRVEKRRPDVLMVHQSLYSRFSEGRSYAQDITALHPELQPLFQSYFSTGAFPLEELSALLQHRPVLLENDTLTLYGRRTQEGATAALLPDPDRFSLGNGGLTIPPERLAFDGPGLLLLPEGGTKGASSPAQLRFWSAVYNDLACLEKLPEELVKLLVWYHYRNALFFLNSGEPNAAKVEVHLARMLRPQEKRLAELEDALSPGGKRK